MRLGFLFTALCLSGCIASGDSKEDSGAEMGVGGSGGTGGAGGAGGAGGTGGSVGPIEGQRPGHVECARERPPPEGGVDAFGEEGCDSHEACDEGPNGRCLSFRFGTMCVYDKCFTDGDCGEGVCECAGGLHSGHYCANEGNCQVDGDCGEGGRCSPSYGDCGNYGGIVGYWCHTPEDTCARDADCEDGGDCRWSPAEARFSCSTDHCVG